MTHRLSVMLAGLVLLSGLAAAPPTPLTPAPPPAEPTPPTRPDLYDETADAEAVIGAALARAKKENRRVLIQWGADWCGWCHVLHGVFTNNAAVKRKLQYEYDVVLVDIGQWDRNLALAERYGANFKAHGVPYLTVLDAEGNVVANRETGSLEVDDKSRAAHDPQKVIDLLTEHQAPYRSAEDILKEGLRRAAAEKKIAFVHFGAPWCGWCHRLEGWMADEAVAPILGRRFVDVKIDIDRTLGGPALLKRYRPRVGGGIPWFAFLAPDGKLLATSDGPQGNLGCPWTDEELARFRTLLAEVAPEIPLKDVERITAVMAATRDELQRRLPPPDGAAGD